MKIINLALSVALLLGLAGKSNAGIFYSQNQVNENIKLEQVLAKIKEKYPTKNLEYFSVGSLQFKNAEFVQDSEIDKMIQDLNPKKDNVKTDPNYVVDGVNFSNDSCIIIDYSSHHLGDEKKSWLPIKEPEGLVYEKKFTINRNLKNPRLGIETIFSHSDNEVYINGNLVGNLPKMPRDDWGKRAKKLRDKLSFLYGEIDVSKYLKQGENTLRIEAKKPKGDSGTYNDFMIRRMQIIYSEE